MGFRLKRLLPRGILRISCSDREDRGLHDSAHQHDPLVIQPGVATLHFENNAMLGLLPFCLMQLDSFKTEELANVALSLAKTFGESADVALPPDVAWPLESGGGVS